jgi:hypothetical protein
MGCNGSFFKVFCSSLLISFISFSLQASVVPVITVNPQNVTARVGDTATFKVAATGDSISFRWYQDSAGVLINLQGVNVGRDSVYKRRISYASDDGKKFCCVVSNRSGKAISTSATLTVLVPPTIVSQPLNDSVNLGETADFKVSATSKYPPMKFQWMKRAVSDTSFSNVTGSVDSVISVPTVVAGDHNTAYRCVVSDSGGSSTTRSALIFIKNLPPPVITVEPVNVTGAKFGDTISFKISVSGVVTRFQWQRDSGNLVFSNLQFGSIRADSIFKKVAAITDTFVRSYRCIVSNTGGSDTSAPAKLITKKPPMIITQPKNDSVAVGANATFKISATTLYPPLSFQWQRSSGGGGQFSNITGAIDSTYTFTGVADSNNNLRVRCQLTDSSGTVSSGTAMVIIRYPAPSILTEPIDKSVNAGDTAVKFILSVKGSDIDFSWRRDSAGTITSIQGGGNKYQRRDSVLQIRRAALSDSGCKFSCIISNSGGSDTSAWALLIVKSTGIITQSIAFSPIRFTASPNIVRANRPIKFLFTTAGAAKVKLSVYNHQGKKIFSDSWLETGKNGKPLANRYWWDLKNTSGNPIAAGAYITTLSVKGNLMNKVEKTKFEVVK